ncbi:uncharacterized protein LOC144710063 [Wolffia australiana]
MEFFLQGGGARSVVYAGLDSIVTSLSLISSISGGRGPSSASPFTATDIVVLGFANLVADGIAMALGDFLSTATAQDISPKREDPPSPPWKNALLTFLSFLAFGSAPLLAFVVSTPFDVGVAGKFIAACSLAGFALALLGAARARVTGRSYATSVFVTVFTGAIASASAFSIGWILRNLVGFALALLGSARARVTGRSYATSVFVTVFTGAIASASAFSIGWILRNVAHFE